MRIRRYYHAIQRKVFQQPQRHSLTAHQLLVADKHTAEGTYAVAHAFGGFVVQGRDNAVGGAYGRQVDGYRLGSLRSFGS